MFTRKNESYNYNEKLIGNILRDSASPLTQIYNIIPEGSKVLDVGAGNGLLARIFLFQEKRIIIDGVEPNEFASSLAKKEYRHFYNGYIQEFIDEILDEEYDFIVFADVIEHIDDPVNVLKFFFEKLSLSTKIIISTPNVGFGAVRLSLMKGRFNYVDSGILEKTHLRFYTLESLKLLIHHLNLNIETLYCLNRNFNNTEIKLNELKLNPLLIYFVNKDKLSHTYQFLTVLSKSKVDIVVEEIFGKKTRLPIIEYLFKPIIWRSKKMKNFVKLFYK